MRVARLSLMLAVAALFAALLLPGAARSASMQYVADVKGRFKIGFPAGWRVATLQGDAPAVQGIDEQSDVPYLNVNVVVESLPQAISSAELGRRSKPMMAQTLREFTVLQEGPTQIAHRTAYYRYYTWKSNTGNALYQVQTYFTVGLQGFVLTGTTGNDRVRIRKDVPIISQIFETFTPVAK